MKRKRYLVALRGATSYHTLTVTSTLKHYKKFGIKYKVVAKGSLEDIAIGYIRFSRKEPALVVGSLVEVLGDLEQFLSEEDRDV